MSRTIRVFISSTFTHFDDARNKLVAEVFPKIQKLCLENGFTFRAVDLRWGITEDEGRNHQVADICFEEIRRCQEYSPAPNFIVLSDDYYGWIPIPASISPYCWERIAEYLDRTDGGSLAFLKKWYRRDLNDLSGYYFLQDVWNGDDSREGRISLDKTLEDKIGDILFPAAQAVFKDEYPLRVAFGGSLTEQEINLGLFSKEGANEHTLVMIREKENLSEGSSNESSKESSEESSEGSSKEASKVSSEGSSKEASKVSSEESSEESSKEASEKCSKESSEESGNSSKFNAHNLNERLKDVKASSGKKQWIPFHEDTFQKEALVFLEKVVRRQINKVQEEEKKESAFDRECRELQEALEEDAKNFIDEGGRLESLRKFSDIARGRAALVMGKQGSGKSMLLKYYASKYPDQCCGVFTDLQRGRGTVKSALDFFAGVLHRRDLLRDIPQRDPCESCAGYFERQMEGLRKGTKITLVMDCAENISDFRMQEESLFSMKLPEGVALLISCVDKRALSGTDLMYAPPVLEVGDIQRQDMLPMLLGMLERYGRTLSVRQQEMLRRVLPEQVTPLYLRLLSSVLQRVPEYGGNDAAFYASNDVKDDVWEISGDFTGRNNVWRNLIKNQLPENAFILARTLLEREMQVHLPDLYRHILACIALSAQGIQEDELIRILLREVSDGSRLHTEILRNSHWEITSMEHVLNIFWSRMHFQLQHFLGIYPSRENLLVRFRHGLMKEAALEIVKQEVSPETACTTDAEKENSETRERLSGILEETSRAIRDYWIEQKPYIHISTDDHNPADECKEEDTSAAVSAQEKEEPAFASSQGEEKVAANRRRADELLPILLYRGEKEKAGTILDDPYYIDVMIRLDRCVQVMNQLEAAWKGGYAGDQAVQFLNLLEDHEILLTSFMDSFLPLCVQHGLVSPEALTEIGGVGYFTVGKSFQIGSGRGEAWRFSPEESLSPEENSFHKDNPVSVKETADDRKDLMLQVPGSRDAPMALRGDGIMAIMSRGSIRIYDWRRRRYSSASFPMKQQRFDFLCWKGGLLVLRRSRARICFRYEKRPGGAGEELLLEKEESCANLLDLFADSEEKRRKAGDIEEEEAVSMRTNRRLFYYTPEGVCKQRLLGYPPDSEIEYYLRRRQAAVVKNREEIDFVDLEAGTVKETLRIPNVTGVFISDDGKTALIRTWGESIFFHQIIDRDVRPMPVWNENEKTTKKELRSIRYSKDIPPVSLFSIRKKQDLPWLPAGDPTTGTPSPLLTCMSVEGGWFACYYHFNNLSAVKLFDMKTGEEILSSETEPVFCKDMEDQPLRAEGHGTKLVLQSSGVRHVLSLDTDCPAWRRERGKSSVLAVESRLISGCRQHMWRWFPQGRKFESMEDLIKNSFDTALGRFAFRLFTMGISPLLYILMPEKVNNPEIVHAEQTIRTGQYLWVIDQMYRTVHIADSNGRWLCHTQVKEAFAAADAKDNILYLLSENRECVRKLCFFPG